MKVSEQRPLLANVKMGAFATVFGFVLAFIAWTLWRLKPELPPLFDPQTGLMTLGTPEYGSIGIFFAATSSLFGVLYSPVARKVVTVVVSGAMALGSLAVIVNGLGVEDVKQVLVGVGGLVLSGAYVLFVLKGGDPGKIFVRRHSGLLNNDPD